MNLFLVRHAQSESNVNRELLKIKSNMSINLSLEGLNQAEETGSFLSNFFQTNKNDIKIWNSPYQRTRKTSEIIKKHLIEDNILFQEEESIYLSEIQHGLYRTINNYEQEYHNEHKHYNLHKKNSHEFFARTPLGESHFDLAIRLDFFLKTIIASESHIENHVVVTHGAAVRCLIMMQQKQNYDNIVFKNPLNSSVHMISNNINKGQIFAPLMETN